MKRLSLAAVLGLLGSAMARADEGPRENVLFKEDFTAKPGAGWSWIREDPDAWRIDHGSLVLRTSPGYLHGTYNNSRNVLLHTLPKSDHSLAIEVHVESEPKVRFEHGGVVWYVDDDNYVALFQEMLDNKVMLQMIAEKDGKPSGHATPYADRGVWMRLVLLTDSITSQYRSSENEPWREVGRATIPAHAEARVGVMAGGAPKDAQRHVRFRAFRILEIVNK